MYIPTDLSITGPQLKNLILRGTCQISKDGLKDCNSRVLLNKLMHDRVEKARKSGRGVRLVADIPEIRQTGVRGLKGSGMSGTGWWSNAVNWVRENAPKAFNWIKDEAIPWVKSNVIDSEVYKSKLRPKVEGLIMDKLSGLPYADTTKDIAQATFDYTGLGLKPKPKPKAKAKAKPASQSTGGSFRVN
jgi:hypothetical protein